MGTPGTGHMEHAQQTRNKAVWPEDYTQHNCRCHISHSNCKTEVEKHLSMFSNNRMLLHVNFNVMESAALRSAFVLPTNLKSGLFSLKREKKLSICLTFPFHIFISLYVRTSPAESQNKSVRSLVLSWIRVSVGTNWCLSLFQPFVQGWPTLCLIVNELWMWGNNLPEWILFFSSGFLNFTLCEGAESCWRDFFWAWLYWSSFG